MDSGSEWHGSIYEISKAINATLEVNEILRVIANEVPRHTDYHRLVVGLVDGSGERLRMYVADHDGVLRESESRKLEGCALAHVIHSSEPLTVPDLTADDRFPQDNPLTVEGARSCVVLPLRASGEVLGALAVARADLTPFTDGETAMLLEVAEQTATAVRHARLLALERKRASHFSLINDLAARALTNLDLDVLLEQTATLIQHYFAYYDVGVFLLDPDSREVVLRAQAGAYSDESVVGYRQPVGQGMVGWTAQTGETQLASDVTRNPHYIVAFEGERNARCELCVPIRVADRIVGVINIESTQIAAFDEIDVLAMETLADQVAQAIENARLVEQIRREKRKLDEVVSAMGAGLMLIDRDLHVVWSNTTMDEWFGDGQSLMGMKCHDVCYQRDTPCPDCEARQTFESGAIKTTTQVTVTQELGPRRFQNILAPIHDETGQVAQVIRLTLDVTEHARKVEQIALIQRLTQAMQGTLELDRLLHLILTCVTGGPGLGFNRAFLLLADETRTTLEGSLGVGPTSEGEAARIWAELSASPQTLSDLLTRADEPVDASDSAIQYLAQQIHMPLSNTDAVVARVFREKRSVRVAHAADDPGVTPHLRALLGADEFVCVPLVSRDEALGVILADNVFTRRPITPEDVEMLETFATHAGLAVSRARAYNALEEQLNQLAEAQDRLLRSERLATVGRLAAHVAHEIRNPLATIGGFTYSLLKNPADEAKVARNARIIIEEVERLEQILANVMNFSKPSEPVFRARNINETVDAVCAFHENAFADRSVVLHRSLDPACPEMKFDPDQMRQVLINLVQNALEAMPEGGELTVMTRLLDESVEIVVADTGQGMSESVIESLFQPFYTTKVGGTGLGLSISQKIVQSHGGDILVTSQPGSGSSLTVSLPIAHNT